MSATLTNLVAAQLSAAAYANYSSLTNGATQYTDPVTGQIVQLPANWSVDKSDSAISADGTNQFVTFINSVTHQIVITFKGSDNKANFESDILNNGSQAWSTLSNDATIAYAQLQAKIKAGGVYAGYTVVTDGHSLGGGMAQTFALENNLNGYGQNSLPVSSTSVSQYLQTQGISLAQATDAYQFLYKFTEVNDAGDPATLYYSIGANTPLTAYLYTPATTTTLSNPYTSGETVALEVLGTALITGITDGAAGLLAESAIGAHSINTVISELQAGGATAPQLSVTAAQANAAVADVSAVSSVTVNPNGSSTVTETNGTTYNVATTANAAPPTSLTSLASGETYVFDPGTTNVAYTITGIAGVSTSAIAYDPKDSGTLTFTQDTTPGLKLPDGPAINNLVINIPGGRDTQLVSAVGGTATPEQTLLDYLAQIGDPLTAAQLDATAYHYLNPNGMPYVVPSGPLGAGDLVFSVNQNSAPGAVITGVSGKYNILSANAANLSQDTITGIQEVDATDVSMTQAQFASLPLINGRFGFTATTGGTYNFSTETQQFSEIFATDLVGTTLIGGSASQELLASQFGNDTLQAGNGTGDVLAAGGGKDTLIGGTGGDIFYTYQSLVVGSVVRGNGSGNVFQAFVSGTDLSGATITGVQTLSYSGSITVSLAELSEFSSIVGNGTITVADAGTVAAGSTLKVTGVVTIPTLSISGGGIVTSQGGTLTGLVTVNSGGLMIGYGTINGADTINGTVVSSGGTLNITGDVTGSGTLTVGSGAINLSGSSVTIASASVNAGGSLTVSGADSIANLTDNGTITVASGGSLDVSSALNSASTGIFQLTTKASLEIAAILGSGLKIQFLGSAPTNELTIDSAANFGTNVGSPSYAGPLLESFAAGDTIDLKGIASAGLKLAYASATGDLQIAGSSGNPLATLAFQNSTLGAGAFHTASDGVGGTLITHS